MSCTGSGCKRNCIRLAAQSICSDMKLQGLEYNQCVTRKSKTIDNDCKKSENGYAAPLKGITAGLHSQARGGFKRKSKIRRSKKTKKSRRTRSKK